MERTKVFRFFIFTVTIVWRSADQYFVLSICCLPMWRLWWERCNPKHSFHPHPQEGSRFSVMHPWWRRFGWGDYVSQADLSIFPWIFPFQLIAFTCRLIWIGRKKISMEHTCNTAEESTNCASRKMISYQTDYMLDSMGIVCASMFRAVITIQKI